jgi:hypothetical protein
VTPGDGRLGDLVTLAAAGAAGCLVVLAGYRLLGLPGSLSRRLAPALPLEAEPG